MQKVLFAAQMKEADEREIRRGTPSQILMERAAKAALSVLKREFDTARVLFLCGNGNNGGDGLAMARFLAEEGADVLVCCPLLHGDDPGREMSAEAARQYRLLPQNVMRCSAPFPEGITAVVDALFGIGLSRPIEGELAKILHQIREMAVPVLAVDIPSGVCADTGRVLGTALPAKHTVSMASYKYGQLLYPGTTLCGKLTVADIGVPTDEAGGKLLQREDLSLLPARPARAHKGRFGRVLVIGGSVGMSGAAYFTAKAAYRAGAGLVEIFAPAENRIIYQTQLPEALLTLYDPRALDKSSLRQAIDRADAIAIGMGLGTEALTETLVECVLQRAKVPVLLDADALNCISCSPALFALLACCKCPRILTPHLGEASRLLSKSIPAISEDLCGAAMLLSHKANATVVLKDARTVICNSGELAVNTYGNSGMATGGSGDVLAGVIAAFLAAGTPPQLAAELGVLAHALAGDHAKEMRGSHGLMASDIIDGLSSVLP